MLAEDSAHSADHAGDIAVAQEDAMALEGCLDINVVHGEQTRRSAVKHGALHNFLFRVRFHKNGEHISGAAARCFGFFDL